MRVRPFSSLLLPLLLTSVSGCLDDGSPELGASEQEVINERNATIATGHQHSCAVQPDTTVACWGRNSYGQLGNGTTASSPLPVTVVGITGAVAVTAGKYHSCAALADGTARCWGLGTSGQLGDGATSSRLLPVTVVGLSGVTSISAGGSHTCATLDTSQARCWGSNTYGQLGNDTTTSATSPVPVRYRATPTSKPVTLAGASEIETGSWSTCARISSGAVVCWGRNNYGQLGDGTTTQRLLPVAVSNVTTATDLAVGDTHACAVVANGRVRCWGANLMGQLGDGTQTMRTTAVEMRRQLTPTITYPIVSVTSVTAGQYHSCVISSGNVWCAGNNDDGRLGTAITPYLELLLKQTEPVVQATEIAAGGEHTCVRRAQGGTVLCFGDDSYGQVGDFGRCALVPVATVSALSAPGGRLVRRGFLGAPDAINYVQGDRLELTIETSGCAQVSRVDFRGTTIDEDDPIEPSDGVSYQVVSALDRDDGTRQVVLGVDFDNYENGTSSELVVELTSPAGNRVTTSILVAEVLEADAGNNGYIDIGKEEIINSIVESMYEKFGDQNFWDRGDWRMDFYGFDYAGFGLFLGSDGISFTASAKADLPGQDICDPTVTVGGRFRLIVQNGRIATQWIDAADAHAVYPFGCTVATLVLADLVTEIVAYIKEDSVQAKIEEKIGELSDLCQTALTADCDALVQSITHYPDRVRVTVNRVFESVTYRQPYISSQLGAPAPGTSPRRGILIHRADETLIMSSGIAAVYGTQSSTGVGHYISTSGLFNWNWEPRAFPPAEGEAWGAHPPILDPWHCSVSGACGVYPGRQAAWLRIKGLRRELAGLPMPERNVGALVSRMIEGDGSSSLRFLGGRPCMRPQPTSGNGRLVVGRNDVSAGQGPLDGEYGTGEALVTLVFPGLYADALACEE